MKEQITSPLEFLSTLSEDESFQLQAYMAAYLKDLQRAARKPKATAAKKPVDRSKTKAARAQRNRARGR